MTRAVHFLTRSRFGDLLLGPELRIWSLATKVAEAGYQVVVHGLSGSTQTFPEGIEFRELAPGYMSKIRPGDAIVASELLGARSLLELLRSRRPFHWDCYGLSLPETLSFLPTWSWMRSLGDRRRKMLRYRLLAMEAERIWVSHSGQGVFLASQLAVCRPDREAWRAFQFPSAILEMPMGVPDENPPQGSANPYPESMQGRPILFWGGGIWNWFDVPTVIRAMVELRNRGAPHVLFFLSGRNEATRDYDRPLDEALRLASEANLLGSSIVFNDRRVKPTELAPWLEHCHAGIMGNQRTLESSMSWRTRYLDLLWAGRPLLVAGGDPLAERMARCGAAEMVPHGDHIALADAILSMQGDRWKSACEASSAEGRRVRWSQVAKPFLAELSRPESFSTPTTPPSAGKLLRYALGV
ncbi:MAG TPA: hypothetical protein PKO15_12580 [Fibrobacteria bacterium]|nr:hypothetical protein [Fibrobacteria bacterium]